MKCIINGHLVLPDSVTSGMAIVFDTQIRAIVQQSELNVEEYEIIDDGGQAQYTLERGHDYYAGYYSFEDEELSELILKYCNE